VTKKCKYCKYFAACAFILWTHLFCSFTDNWWAPFQTLREFEFKDWGVKSFTHPRKTRKRSRRDEITPRWYFLFKAHMFRLSCSNPVLICAPMLTTDEGTPERCSLSQPLQKKKIQLYELILGAVVKAYFKEIKHTWQ